VDLTRQELVALVNSHTAAIPVVETTMVARVMAVGTPEVTNMEAVATVVAIGTTNSAATTTRSTRLLSADISKLQASALRVIPAHLLMENKNSAACKT